MTQTAVDLDVAVPARRIPGEEGIWVFVIGDMTVFALFFGVFMYTRGHDPAAFTPGQPGLDRTLGAINTMLLLTGSLLAVLGVRACRTAPARTRMALFLSAAACAAGFVVIKAVEWSRQFAAGHTVGTNDFYSYYFVFTGIHLLHVLIGIVVLLRVAFVVRKETLESRDHVLAESGGIFWHMVDLLWIVLFALFYLMHNGVS
ncbi:cytochrome c oxidase subunit 3 [Nocardia sp. NPDC059239]|uniref:cytochrome c oxidase subunit 3 n=1 Tax=unclassified Nocardia TaxID=2637762 RepID=UPI0036AC4D08